MTQTNVKQISKGIRYGGRYQKITLEICERVAQRRAQGLSLRRALSLENPPIPFSHWQNTLQKLPRMAGLFMQKETQALLPLIEQLRASAPGQWQKVAWLLERSFPDDYSTRATAHVHVSGTVLLGVAENIRERSSAFARDRVQEPKQMRGKQRRKLPAPVIEAEVIKDSANSG